MKVTFAKYQAKIHLNSVYGYMASLPDSPSIQEKKPGYIDIGATVVSYAKGFTNRLAQKNFYGEDKPGFIYADTGSINCELTPEECAKLDIILGDITGYHGKTL